MPDGSVPEHNTRPFNTLDEMNACIVNNINNVVMPGDSLFFLGDWSFGGFDNIKKFYDRLSCKNICFIYGNHDHHVKNKEETQRLFVSVDHYKILIVDKIKFVLMHYPISSWDGLDNGFMHLHGHMHFKGDSRFGKGRRMDVGMDGHPEFRPYNLMEEVVPILTKRPIVSEFSNDHHLDGL